MAISKAEQFAGLKFAHFIDSRMTIGYRINDTDKTIDYTASFVHPNDSYFHPIARNVVAGRLKKGGVKQNGKLRFNTIPMSDIVLADGERLNHRVIVQHITDLVEDPIFTHQR